MNEDCKGRRGMEEEKKRRYQKKRRI